MMILVISNLLFFYSVILIHCMLIVVRGLPGTGKTFFSESFASAINAMLISSDRLRSERGLRGRYEDSVKELVYKEMFDRARSALAEKKTCLLDATFSKQDRIMTAARLSEDHKAGFYVIEMTADASTIKERVSRNRKFSEANLEVYEKIKREYEPMQGDYLLLNSSELTLEAMIARAKKYIGYDGNST